MVGVKKIQFNGNKYLAVKIVGKGQFGIVYDAKPKFKKLPSGKKVPKRLCIKEYFYTRFYDPSTQKNNCEEYFEREVKATKIQGEYTGSQMKLIDAGKNISSNTNEYYIVLTFIPGKTLRQWFADTFGKQAHLNEDEINQITHDIIIPLARHLNFCHNQGLVHRDLSLDNILIMEPHKGVAVPVIIDWGASKIRSVKDLMYPPKDYLKDKSVSGTAFINKGTPPEIIMGLAPLAASDIYMLGHIMYYLYSGGFSAKTPLVTDDYVLKPKMENPSLDERYDKLVQKCTQYKPSDRIKNMEEILHIIEKVQEDYTPSRITFFEKPKTYPVGPAQSVQSGGVITPRVGTGSISSANSPQNHNRISPDNLGDGIKKISSIPQRSPFVNVSAARSPGIPAVGNLIDSQGSVKNPYGKFFKVPTYVESFSSTSDSSNGGAVNIPSTDPSLESSNIDDSNLHDSSHPTSDGNIQSFIDPTSLYYRIEKEKSPFRVNERTISFARGFIQYFDDPRWQYKRQDNIQFYWEFFKGVVEAFKNKNNFIQFNKIKKNIYYIGRTVGSIEDVKLIMNYLQNVLRVEPETKIIFLGNYLSYNRFDIEAFTLILSYFCLYPDNIILLRGLCETRESIEKDGFLSHLKFKFGGYYNYLFDEIIKIIKNLDLIHIAELSPQARAISSGGGIPFNPNNLQDVIRLSDLMSRIDPRHSSLEDVDEITQTIIIGRPNEISASSGRDSKGYYLFCWNQLQEFLKINNAHYCFIPFAEKYGHRTIWNKISLLNSSSYEKNKSVNQAKIIRLNIQGSSDFDLNSLERIFNRDYSSN